MLDAEDRIRNDQYKAGLDLSTKNKKRDTGAAKGHKKADVRVLKGHEGMLKGIHWAGGEVQITLAQSGDIVSGKLAHFDQYTLTLMDEVGESTVYFKHAMESFKQINRLH